MGKEFGKWLEQTRKEEQITQEELGNFVNKSGASISRIESGDRNLDANGAYEATKKLNISPARKIAFLLSAAGHPRDRIIKILKEVGETHIVTQFESTFIVKQGIDATIRIQVSPDGETTVEKLD